MEQILKNAGNNSLPTHLNQDSLVEAKFTTVRGAEYESCLLYVAELSDSTLTISVNQDWSEGSFVYLQLGQRGQNSWEALFVTCRVVKRSRALGGLWFYELSFHRTPDVKKQQAFQVLKPHVAPEGRRYYRHACPNPFEITIRLDHSTQPVDDISCSGLSFVAMDSYQQGDLVNVKVFFENFAFLATLRVDRVVHRGNGFFEYGCTFLELSENDASNLVDYIYRRAQGAKVAGF